MTCDFESWIVRCFNILLEKFSMLGLKTFQYVNSKARCVQSSSSSMYKVFDMLIERYEVPFSFKYKRYSFRIF